MKLVETNRLVLRCTLCALCVLGAFCLLGTFCLLGALGENLLSAEAQETPLAFEVLSEELIERAVELRQRALAESRAYELLAALTSEVGPRPAGSANDRRAVAWAQDKLVELGFSNVRAEGVFVPCWQRGDASGAITSAPARQFDLVALGGSVATPAGGIEADVVEAATLRALEELDRSQVEGKIVFVSTSMPRTRDGSGYGQSARIRRHAPSYAAKLGAVAVLIRSVSTSRHLAHTGTTFYDESAPLIPAAALSNDDADLLSARIETGERVRFRLELGCRFFPDALSANVIGEIPGRERPEEIVLLAAHLDSWDLGTGALDDGAGCAIVMEAARLIGTLDPAPRRTIRVFLAANEEYGVSGGVAYAKRYEKEAALHVAAMEADLGAARVFRLLSSVGPRAQPAVRELGRLLAPLGIEDSSDGTLGGTDLLPMNRHRIPLFELRQDGTDYFDHYHSAGDTLDKADADDLAQVVAAFAVTALVAAEHDDGFGRRRRFTPRLPEPFDQLMEGRARVSPARSKYWIDPFGYKKDEIFPIEIGFFGFPLVPVVINGTSLKLPFDTGNMVGLSLSTWEFDRLGLEESAKWTRRSSDGRVAATLRVGAAGDASVFGRHVDPKRIYEVDFPDLPGLVGPDIVGKGHFTLDYVSKRFAMSDRALPAEIPGFRSVPLVRSERHPALVLVRGTIEGRHVVIELDTGKSRTVINPTLAKELSLKKNARGVAIETLRIGDLCLSVPSAKEVDQRAIDPDLAEPILAGIGSDLLSRFTWTVDYDKGVLWIPISPQTERTTEEEERTLGTGAVGERIVAFAERAASTGFSGAVLAAKGGEVIAAVGVGSADLEGAVPITPATLFEIASATKQFTAAAVMVLVQQGRLGLDDPIAKHLDGVPEECAAITVRHLLQHTSGIPGTNSQGGGDDLDAVLPKFLRGGPAHTPGTHWEYWNQGYALLSEIIARGAEQDYVSFCKKALFAPAGMTKTLFTGDEAPENTTVATGFSARGQPRSALDHPYGSYGFQYRGMGGAVTSVWDLWRWDRALGGDEILGADAKKELFRPGLRDYALGWFVWKNPQGKLTHSHGGGVRGFACDVRRYPEEDACLFVLCNRDDFQAWRIAKVLEEILFSDHPGHAMPPRMVDAEAAAAVAGRYEEPGGKTLTITVDGKVVRAETSRQGTDGKPKTTARAYLGLDDNGKLVYYDWASSVEVTLKRKGDEPAIGLSFNGERYARVD